MNEQTVELIAIGASVAAHCQPCLTYHLDKARKLGVAQADIQKAIRTGYLVEQGAAAAMRTFVSETFGQGEAQDAPCCPGSASKCCG